jgi:hypothetical protein
LGLTIVPQNAGNQCRCDVVTKRQRLPIIERYTHARQQFVQLGQSHGVTSGSMRSVTGIQKLVLLAL